MTSLTSPPSSYIDLVISSFCLHLSKNFETAGFWPRALLPLPTSPQNFQSQLITRIRDQHAHCLMHSCMYGRGQRLLHALLRDLLCLSWIPFIHANPWCKSHGTVAFPMENMQAPNRASAWCVWCSARRTADVVREFRNGRAFRCRC